MSDTHVVAEPAPRPEGETGPEVPAVFCRGVRHRFGDHFALDGVDLVVRPAEVFGLLGSAFFSCLSMTIAGIVLKRDRLMGIGQMITMPMFFASNALYPVSVMPGWLKALSAINPLSYEVDALRGLLIGTHAHLVLDFTVVGVAVVIGVTTASSLVGRLAR